MTGTHPKNQARMRRRLRTDRRRTRATQRRGILMLVVLSMLILFMLMGTTFLITSSQYKESSEVIEERGRTTFQPEDVLERALMQLVRDTNNRHSAARYHSLLRDLYGADGFVGRVFMLPAAQAGMPTGDYRPVYAGAQPSATTNRTGVTEGQLVDIYIVDIERTATSNALEENKVEGIEIGNDGLSIEHSLSQTDSYYNGCLLTLLGGPCRGSSVRVIDYDHISTQNTINGDPVSPTVTLGRFRVMAPRRADGRSLSFDGTTAVLSDFIKNAQLGYKVVVNGRPFNGTGVGFNAIANPNAPRLTALEELLGFPLPFYAPLALVPNATTYDKDSIFFEASAGVYNPLVDGTGKPLYTVYPGPGGADESYDAADFQNMFLALQSPQPRVRGRVVRSSGGSLTSVDPDRYYPAGNGTAPERLDLEDVTIPSFHRPALVNYWLHRLADRLVADGASPQDAALAVLLPYGADMQRGSGDETVSNAIGDLIVDIKRKAMMRPLREDHPGFDGSNALSRYDASSTNVHPENATLTNTNDEITFPYWEAVGPWDVDNDRDGAPDSVWIDMGLPVQKTADGRFYKPLVAMLVEDLDGRLNLNAHGSSEHLANDANFVPDGGAGNDDLDVSSIGANLAQDYDNSPILSSSNQLPHGSGWGTADISLRPILSPDLPLYDFQSGSALSANAQYDDYARLLVGRPDPRNPIDRNEDSLPSRIVSDAVKTTVTFGRYGSFPGSDPKRAKFYSPGRTLNTLNPTTLTNSREERVPFDFPGYPLFATDPLSQSAFGQRPDLFSRYGTGLGPTGTLVQESVADGRIDLVFGTRRSILDESPYELNLSADARRGAVADLDAVKNSYGTTDPIVDDAPFSAAELERILRAFDFDADKLPDRLWNLVDAFDPQKLAVQDAIIRGLPTGIDDPDDMRDGGGLWNPNSLERMIAQAKAAINRRQVTTESWDLPVPNENWTARLLLGADGLPGVAFDDPTTPLPANEADDDGDGDINEGDELGLGVFDPTDGVDFNDSDDYLLVMGKLPRQSARLADYMEYRITLELFRQKVITSATQPNVVARHVSEILVGSNDRDATYVRTRDTTGATADAGFTSLPVLMSYGGLLAPEVLAGLKMDLNRPFGDGRDNNGNGVVDEPQEAGEPYVDTNGDGIWENGEPYLDLDNDGFFYADANQDGVLSNADWFDFDGDGIFEPTVDSLWGQTPGGPFPFDYTRGADANGRGAYIDSDNNASYDYNPATKTGEPRIYDDGQMARQLYARHLYCLMLAVTDENYLAPYDESDPQVLHYIDSRSGRLDRGQPVAGSSVAYRLAFELGGGVDDPNSGGFDVLLLAEARRLAMKKLTRRQIAQWAINTVDMRDPDAIQTPFEYDENPWDGWNVVDPVNGIVFPLDGDIATDENHAYIRPITATGWVNVQQAAPPGAIAPTLWTRGVVWGAERPELLMTEGLALHDRRLSDEALALVEGPSDNPSQPTELDLGKEVDGDDDLDQLLKPQGSAFLEIYNPWSADDQKPTELYSRQTELLGPAKVLYRPNPDNYQFLTGVALDRLSNGVALRRDPSRAGEADKVMRIERSDGFRKRPGTGGGSGTPITLTASPVWRVICVEEHPDVRNNVPFDNPTNPEGKLRPPTANDSPWVYSPRSIVGPTTTPLPSAYRRVADLLAPGAVGSPPSTAVFLQADPDWPSFDRFVRPGSVLSNGRSGEEDVDISYVANGVNVSKTVKRIQLTKPDRYIERAFYFVGAPEINAPASLPANEPFLAQRNLVQPGLVIPDLSYEYLPPSGSSSLDLTAIEEQIAGDHDILGAAMSDANASSLGIEFYRTNADRMSVNGNRFVATDRFDVNDDTTPPINAISSSVSVTAESQPLAPIMPGRYAVIGPANASYEYKSLSSSTGIDLTDSSDIVTLANRYTTVLAREHQLPSDPNWPNWERYRRIELIPSAEPNQHQVVIRFNGRIPIVPDPSAPPPIKAVPRHSEVIEVIEFGSGNRLSINVTELPNPSQPGFLFADPADLLHPESIQPVVAIPVEGFNISEPLDGYHLRRNELLLGNPAPNLRVTPSRWNPEGEAMGVGVSSPTVPFGGFDQPLDVLQELLTDSTTPNYRTLHLQRLANPLLAWNPEPLRPNGDIVTEHDPSRPVNPYLTIDSLPMDLISYNGALKPPTSGAGPDHQPLASVERGIEPGTPRIDSNSPTLAGVEGVTSSVSTNEMSPRDLWRAATGLLANRDEDVAYGNIKDHPDQFFFDSEAASTGSGSGNPPYDVVLQHSLGFANRGAGNLMNDADLGAALNSGAVGNVDLNGDGINGDLVGALDINATDDDRTDTKGKRVATGPSAGQLITPDEPDGIPDNYDTIVNNQDLAALHWPNRPFVSEMELLQVPAWSSSRMLTYYSTYNHQLANQPNPYNGDVLLDNTSPTPAPVAVAQIATAHPETTNRVRWKNQQAPFGHLLNFFQTASAPAQVYPWENPAPPATLGEFDPRDGVIVYGAPHFYRILDYVHVPSRFVATDTLLNPQVFGQVPPLGDVRQGLIAPFNRVDSYREPGKVNLNTVVGRRDTDETPSSGSRTGRPADLWSAVYDGLMHRRQDSSALDYSGGNLDLLQLGHLGPAWRDIVVSRRGYLDQASFTAGTIDYSPRVLNPNFPTFFANPLRSPEGGFNVPLGDLQQGGVDASWLRAHYLSPGKDGAWGERGIDDLVVDKDNDGLLNPDADANRDDAGEAGSVLFGPNADIRMARSNGTVPDSLDTAGVLPDEAAPTPMFSGASTEPSLNTERNPQLRYGPMTRLANLTTTRSGVFAVWITVGFFEVTPVTQAEHPQIWDRYRDTSQAGDPFRPGMEELFFSVYQDGYTLGEEIDIDTGENHRHRGFYIIDRTLPVAFKPGDDANVDKAILLRRRIE